MQAVPERHDVAMEWLRLVYAVPTGARAESLERAVAEACRRHRAHPRDVAVELLSARRAGAPRTLTVRTPIPVSLDGRARDALLRDVETILTLSVPGWRRLTCESGAPAPA